MNPSPCVLAIDTLSLHCTVSVLDSRGRMWSRQGTGRRRHAVEVLGLVEAVLQDAGLTLSSLDVIAILRGPGSFTGLRIGHSVAQGLAFAAGLKVLPLSTLALLAEAGFAETDEAELLCLLGARPGKYYRAAYCRG